MNQKDKELIERRIGLVEGYVSANKNSWKSQEYTVAEVETAIAQWKAIISNNDKGSAPMTKVHTSMVMQELGLEVAEPTKTRVGSMRRDSGVLNRLSAKPSRDSQSSFESVPTQPQDKRAPSIAASASSSPQISRRGSEAKPIKIKEEDLSALIQAEKQVTGLLKDLEKKVSPEDRKQIENFIQRVYKLEIDNKAGKLGNDFNPDTPTKLIKTLNEVKAYLVETAAATSTASNVAAPGAANPRTSVRETAAPEAAAPEAANPRTSVRADRKSQGQGWKSVEVSASVKGSDRSSQAANESPKPPTPAQNRALEHLRRNSVIHGAPKAAQSPEAAVESKAEPPKPGGRS